MLSRTITPTPATPDCCTKRLEAGKNSFFFWLCEVILQPNFKYVLDPFIFFGLVQLGSNPHSVWFRRLIHPSFSCLLPRMRWGGMDAYLTLLLLFLMGPTYLSSIIHCTFFFLGDPWLDIPVTNHLTQRSRYPAIGVASPLLPCAMPPSLRHALNDFRTILSKNPFL